MLEIYKDDFDSEDIYENDVDDKTCPICQDGFLLEALKHTFQCTNCLSRIQFNQFGDLEIVEH